MRGLKKDGTENYKYFSVSILRRGVFLWKVGVLFKGIIRGGFIKSRPQIIQRSLATIGQLNVLERFANPFSKVGQL